MEVSMTPWDQAMLAVAEAITYAAQRRRLDEARRWCELGDRLIDLKRHAPLASTAAGDVDEEDRP